MSSRFFGTFPHLEVNASTPTLKSTRLSVRYSSTSERVYLESVDVSRGGLSMGFEVRFSAPPNFTNLSVPAVPSTRWEPPGNGCSTKCYTPCMGIF